jgi:hypothetical protein
MANTSITYSGIEITSISPWIPVSKVPSNGSREQESLNERYGKSGVYQVALTSDIEEIGDSIVHPKIGYTGKSKDIITRTYDIRQPAGSHGAGRYIRQNGYDKDTDVKVRYIYTSSDDCASLEREIHEESRKKYGYRFAWTSASAGNDGVFSQMIELSNKLTVDEILDIIPLLKQLAVQKNSEEFLERLKEV